MSDDAIKLKRYEDIKGRLAKISPGPWEWRWNPHLGCAELLDANDSRVHTDGSACGEYCADIAVNGPDAAFIAAAPEDIDFLLKRAIVAKGLLERILAVQLSSNPSDYTKLNDEIRSFLSAGGSE